VRVVKMIGDAAMFAAREPVTLMDAVTGLVDTAGDDEISPLRAGAACGPALGRRGDW
jgi:class 3 adenylate cyclase